jgi:biopolymer transport protein ExbB
LTLAQAAPNADDTLAGKDEASATKTDASANSAAAKDTSAADGSKDTAQTSDDASQTAESDAESGVETATGDAWYDHGALGLMNTGGLFMWPILILGVLAAGVIIERYRSLRMLRTDTAMLRDEVRELLQADLAEDALKVVDGEEGPVPAVLGTGLRKYVVLRRLGYDSGRLEQGVVKSMEDYGVHIVAALERHLPILATIASVAPMLGFLGTVAGMIEAFDQIELLAGKENIIKLAAGGIKVALLTTCFGLIVGIPVYMAYNYFTGLINSFVLEVEESATDLIESVTLQNAISDSTE